MSSVRGTLVSWIETRLEAQISYLRDAIAIATPEEFEELGRHTPTIGILVPGGTALETASDDEQYVELVVSIYFSAEAIQGTDLSGANGAYELQEDIHAALKGQMATGAHSKFRYLSDAIEEMENSWVQGVIEYAVGYVI